MTIVPYEKKLKKYFGINIVSAKTKDATLRFDSFRASPKFYDESGLEFSPEGINIMCSKTLPQKTKVEMKLLIPEDNKLNRLNAKGTIESSQKIHGKTKDHFVIGIKFNDLASSTEQQLIELWEKGKQ